MKRKALFKFTPFSHKQKVVLEWWMLESPYADKDGIICDGSIRSGKTTVMSLSFILWAMETFDGQNLALCGKTIQSLRRNVIGQLKRMLLSRGYQVEEHRSENYMVVRKGDKENTFYLFGGKDEGSQDLIQGITLAGVFFDEVALMPESFVNQATGRCSVEGSKYWFNCNPEGPDHYIKLEWIDKITEKNLIRVHFTMRDNPSLAQEIIPDASTHSPDMSVCTRVCFMIGSYQGCGCWHPVSSSDTLPMMIRRICLRMRISLTIKEN